MNIIIIMLTQNETEGSKLSLRFYSRGANYLAIEMNVCVCLSFLFEPFLEASNGTS
jgi:hypothetical protein